MKGKKDIELWIEARLTGASGGWLLPTFTVKYRVGGTGERVFVETESYAEAIKKLGELRDRVHCGLMARVAGAPVVVRKIVESSDRPLPHFWSDV